jgi:acetate kinase
MGNLSRDMPEGHVILCVNSGSSSLKLAWYRVLPGTEEHLFSGAAANIGLPDGRISVRNHGGAVTFDEPRDFRSRHDAMDALFAAAEGQEVPRPDAAGHRVVHGGPHHVRPEQVTQDLMESLRRCIPLAPLHLPAQIAGMELIAQSHPELSQVACYDTAFHQSMPELARRLPLPRQFWDEGVRKYGFHGLSYDYIVHRLGENAKGAVVVAHLGNGTSLAAMRDGHPVDTTMGLTPTGGTMMSTRTGDLDPGVLLYALNEKGYEPSRLARLFEKESGLLGVSGTSSDMKALIDASPADPHAAQAVEMYCYGIRKHIGALAAALGGLDLLVFTGGIGEHSPVVRRRVCDHLAFLGIELDSTRNGENAGIISTDRSRCVVRMIHTDEALMIARYTCNLLFGRT